MIGLCKEYIILTLKVRKDKLFPKIVKVVENIKGKIEYINEEDRRITASILTSYLNNIISILQDYSEYVVYEIKSSCRFKDRDLLERILKERLKFRKFKSRSSYAFIGVFNNRIYFIEVKDKKVYIKIGREGNEIPSQPFSPTLFVFEALEESFINKLLKELKLLISILRGAM